MIPYEQSERLLAIDLTRHRGNADKLYEISTDLQALGKEQKAEISILQTKKTVIETRMVAQRGSRRTTEESKSSTVKSILGGPDDTALVFSLLDNGLTVRQIRGMKDADYIKAELPPFQWWSDCLYIYFEKRTSSDLSAQGRPEVVVRPKLGEDITRDATFVHRVRLGQLGFRIKLQRILGRIQFLYVLYPRPRPKSSPELAKVIDNGTALPLMEEARIPLQSAGELKTLNSGTTLRESECKVSPT